MTGESILTTIKKLLGVEEEYTQFDTDIIVNINSIFMVLNQLGVGPETGFSISDKTKTWYDYLGENANFDSVKSYMYLKVRLLFDPPSNAFLVQSMERLITEFEWRLNAQAEGGGISE